MGGCEEESGAQQGRGCSEEAEAECCGKEEDRRGYTQKVGGCQEGGCIEEQASGEGCGAEGCGGFFINIHRRCPKLPLVNGPSDRQPTSDVYYSSSP